MHPSISIFILSVLYLLLRTEFGEHLFMRQRRAMVLSRRCSHLVKCTGNQILAKI